MRHRPSDQRVGIAIRRGSGGLGKEDSNCPGIVLEKESPGPIVTDGEKEVRRTDPLTKARPAAGRQEGVGDRCQCQALVGWQRRPALEKTVGEVDVEGVGIGGGGLDPRDEIGKKSGSIRPLPLETDPTASVAPGVTELVARGLNSQGSEQKKKAEQTEEGCAKDDLVAQEVDGDGVKQEKRAEQAEEACTKDEEKEGGVGGHLGSLFWKVGSHRLEIGTRQGRWTALPGSGLTVSGLRL